MEFDSIAVVCALVLILFGISDVWQSPVGERRYGTVLVLVGLVVIATALALINAKDTADAVMQNPLVP